MHIRWSKVNFIAAIVGARVSMGLFSNITSPTLPTLAQNCNVSIATVSWIFTVRSVASFIGAAGVHSGLFYIDSYRSLLEAKNIQDVYRNMKLVKPSKLSIRHLYYHFRLHLQQFVFHASH